MNWLEHNRFLGVLVIASSILVLGAFWFSLATKGDWNSATIRFGETSAELTRLERLAPYPSHENLRQVKGHLDEYARGLDRLKDELKTHVLPLQPLAPSEFQSHLRLTMGAVSEKARANKVRLPDKFYLGFDEFASALPNTNAAPLLGQELGQIEALLDVLLEARVEALTSFRRTRLREEQGTVSASSASVSKKAGVVAAAATKSIERNVVDATFVSTPEVARRVLNQIAAANKQFFIVRLLRVRNEKEKGPPRESSAEPTNVIAVSSSPGANGSPEAKPGVPTPLNFIVGNERIEVSAKIEMVRFTF